MARIKNTLNRLDNIELLSVEQQKSAFPEHYHETFCISLIKEGTEVIKMQNASIFSMPGSISITNPYEIHANPLLEKEQSVSFETIYLSQDVVDFYLKEKKVAFQNTQLENSVLPVLFDRLSTKLLNNGADIEQALSNFLISLRTLSNKEANKQFSQASNWAEILLYIEKNLSSKLTIDTLARFMNMDKFNFAKQFRHIHGMSPMNYVLMRKIFAAKKWIQADTNLTALAYEFEFSDQAHFSKTFKRFIGVSPNVYKKSLLF